jgi:hypothetical protein
MLDTAEGREFMLQGRVLLLRRMQPQISISQLDNGHARGEWEAIEAHGAPLI